MIKFSVSDDIPHPNPERSARFVGHVVGALGTEDHALHFHPRQVLWQIALGLVFVGLCVFEEQHSDEKVQEEKTAYEDEHNEEGGLSLVILKFRSLVFSDYI